MDPVLDELRARPRTDAGDTLAAVLSTPPMVSPARGAYDASPDRDPAELLGTGRFGSPAAVEAHLLADHTLAAYRRPPHDGLRRRWEPEDAERWSGYLAWHLTELGTPDLDWWKLGAALGHRTRVLAVALVSGLVIGLVFTVVRKFPLGAAGFEGGFADWVLLVLFDAVVFGPLFALGAGITMGLTAWLETPLDTRSAVGPLDLLRRSRANTAFRVLVVVPVLGLVIGVGSGPAFDLARVLLAGTGFHVRWDAASRISIGLVAGLGCGIGYAFSATAWGRWATLARVWLPLAGRLPWAVPAFLDDAHRRGVLRQSGVAYLFRHARLQEQLDRTYRPARRNRRRSGGGADDRVGGRPDPARDGSASSAGTCDLPRGRGGRHSGGPRRRRARAEGGRLVDPGTGRNEEAR
ncbi:hypothetical protein [Saccharothrix texasensis]|uniref:Uncharacterized protein n=1 Tax=Saccharothrix texasensis TaxID=103734 RepID=A0A3N1GXK8_9PSEU|nr:hypothetical protein [Saccharothrix texasensis]ROP34846.1 hypothetical protein EDD40_0050 [Saccharothrix texasensis]